MKQAKQDWREKILKECHSKFIDAFFEGKLIEKRMYSIFDLAISKTEEHFKEKEGFSESGMIIPLIDINSIREARQETAKKISLEFADWLESYALNNIPFWSDKRIDTKKDRIIRNKIKELRESQEPQVFAKKHLGDGEK